MDYKTFSMRKFQENKKKFKTVRSRYYEPLYNEQLLAFFGLDFHRDNVKKLPL
jgi:hypothetical protein